MLFSSHSFKTKSVQSLLYHPNHSHPPILILIISKHIILALLFKLKRRKNFLWKCINLRLFLFLHKWVYPAESAAVKPDVLILFFASGPKSGEFGPIRCSTNMQNFKMSVFKNHHCIFTSFIVFTDLTLFRQIYLTLAINKQFKEWEILPTSRLTKTTYVELSFNNFTRICLQRMLHFAGLMQLWPAL